MAKFRKKPVVIDAIQFLDDSETIISIQQFMDNQDLNIDYSEINNPKLKITTLEGVMEASLHDYIIKGIQGEFYPCKPDIFESYYDKDNSDNSVIRQYYFGSTAISANVFGLSEVAEPNV